MKAGTIIELPDGRVGTLVYNGLDGKGIKWGRHSVTVEDIEEAAQGANVMFSQAPNDFPWYPDAMLREAYSGCDASMEYVGSEFTILI